MENLTLLEYATQWEVFSKRSDIRKSRCDTVHVDLNQRYVARRLKFCIPRVRYLTPLEKEQYYYQQLLLRIPHRCDLFLSSDNITQTFYEECFLRGVFKEGEDVEEALDHAARRNFDPERIQAIAK